MTAKPAIQIIGDAGILDRPKVALFCSVKCPGKLILETYDLAKWFRNEGILVISGFHSPMEQECLRILLRSPHPVIWCLARGMYRRLPTAPIDCRAAVNAGRLVMVSPFPEQVRHITAETAMTRNHLVVEMADAVVVAHATRGGKMETLCRETLAAGKPLYTFEHPENELLLRDGARPVGALRSGSLGGKDGIVKKTNFDSYLDQQMADPVFAGDFVSAGAAWAAALLAGGEKMGDE